MPRRPREPAVKPSATGGALWALGVLSAGLVAGLAATLWGARQHQPAPAGPAVPVLLADSPMIWSIEDLLTPAECDHLLRLARGNWQKSLVTVDQGGLGGEMRRQRDSWTFYATDELSGRPVQDPVVLGLLRKVHEAARVPLDYKLGEDLQLTWYGQGGRYTLHPDSTMEMGRLISVLVFLKDVEGGGETIFPYARAVDPAQRQRGNSRWSQLTSSVGHDDDELTRFCRDPLTLKVKPKRGRAVMWHNHFPSLMFNGRSVHAGCEVNGSKAIAQRWIRWFDQESGNMFAREQRGIH